MPARPVDWDGHFSAFFKKLPANPQIYSICKKEKLWKTLWKVWITVCKAAALPR